MFNRIFYCLVLIILILPQSENWNYGASKVRLLLQALWSCEKNRKKEPEIQEFVSQNLTNSCYNVVLICEVTELMDSNQNGYSNFN